MDGLTEARPTRPVSVVAMPSVLDPGRRQNIMVPPGSSIASIVDLALPDAPEAVRGRCRVTIGDAVVPASAWAWTRPRPGTTVLVRAVPGDNDTLRNVLLISATVAAIALGQFYAAGATAAAIAGATGFSAAAQAAVVTTATNVRGGLCLDGLVATV